jgi:hypothetical protein
MLHQERARACASRVHLIDCTFVGKILPRQNGALALAITATLKKKKKKEKERKEEEKNHR